MSLDLEGTFRTMKTVRNVPTARAMVEKNTVPSRLWRRAFT